MTYFKTRMVSFLLAFGIFFAFSCTTTEQTNRDNSPQVNSIEQLRERLTSVDEDLQTNPNNSDLLVEKAQLLADIAQKTNPPSQRENYYLNIRDIADQGISSRSGVESLNDIIQKSWSREQGEGVRLLQQDNSGTDNELNQRIAAHLNNAITVNPDSLVTYNLLANTQYRSGDYDQAIETLNNAIAVHGENQPEIREKLAYLYLESGNIESAITQYQNLSTEYPEQPQIKHGLANAYMLNNDHESALEILNELIEEYPNRIEYKESLANELYFVFRQEVKTLLNSRDELSSEDLIPLYSKLDEIDSLYDEISEAVPLSDEHAFRKAAYLKNSALLLEELSDQSDLESIDEKRTEMLEQSLELWERLSENNPDNITYIRTLHDIYLELDMNEEAESLKRSYNL